MFVSSDNATGRMIKKNGFAFCTLNKFFGIGLDNMRCKTITRQCDKLEKEGIQAVVFEEILKTDMRKLMEVKRFVEQNKDKFVIMANGDPFQLLSEQNDKHYYNNVKDFSEFKINAVKRIFPNCIYLNTCKRFKDAKDVKTLERIFNDLFVKDKDVKDVAEKYFKTLYVKWNDDDTLISYSRIAAWAMRKGEMREGMNIRCQDHCGNHGVHINDMFSIESIGNTHVTMKNVIDDEIVQITTYALYKFFFFFQLNYNA